MTPPTDVSVWVGSLVISSLAPVVVFVLTRFFSQKAEAAAATQKAALEAEWKTEVKTKLERILDGLNTLAQRTSLLERDVATLAKGQEQLDRRQSEQGAAHRDAMQGLRAEFGRLATRAP